MLNYWLYLWIRMTCVRGNYDIGHGKVIRFLPRYPTLFFVTLKAAIDDKSHFTEFWTSYYQISIKVSFESKIARNSH